MKLILSALALSLTLAACGNNDADNDAATMGTDTAMAAPADGSMDAGATSANGTGTDMNDMNGQPGSGNATGAMNSSSPSSNMNNAGGTDNSGTGISGGQGANAGSGGQSGNSRAQYPVDGRSLSGGSAPTSTRSNRDNVTNDSLNNRTGMGSSR